jgi:hypothetical protein
MTNGSVEITKNFLERHGLMGFVGECMEVAEVRLWKPRPEVYLHAAKRLGLQPNEVRDICSDGRGAAYLSRQCIHSMTRCLVWPVLERQSREAACPSCCQGISRLIH